MKNLLPLIAVMILAACGFHPVYGVNKYTATGVEEHLEYIQIGSIPDREGQFLRNALIDRFYRDGRPQNPRYMLAVAPVSESTSNLDITIDSDSTRGQLKISTSFTLVDNQTGEEILARRVQSIASYNILDSEFTNRVSEQNTRENVLNDLARQIEQQIALYFKRN